MDRRFVAKAGGLQGSAEGGSQLPPQRLPLPSHWPEAFASQRIIWTAMVEYHRAELAQHPDATVLLRSYVLDLAALEAAVLLYAEATWTHDGLPRCPSEEAMARFRIARVLDRKHPGNSTADYLRRNDLAGYLEQ